MRGFATRLARPCCGQREPASDAPPGGAATRRDDRQEGREARRDERREARGDQEDGHELLRLPIIAAIRDGDLGDRQSVRKERREGRQDSRDDRQEGREARRDEQQERREAIGETTTSCYALQLLRRVRNGDFGDRQSVREERREGRQESGERSSGARGTWVRDERRGDGETTTSCYALLLLRRLARGILEIGSRSERNVARVARKVATIDRRGARGTSGRATRGSRRSGRRPRVVTPCSYCGDSRGGFWRSAVGQRGTSRGSAERRDDRQDGREARRDERREARSDRDPVCPGRTSPPSASRRARRPGIRGADTVRRPRCSRVSLTDPSDSRSMAAADAGRSASVPSLRVKARGPDRAPAGAGPR